ncbi:MAG: hypothetical protein ACI81V_000450 [Lentimonas sp.]|jgi:hypothetical protein
MQRCNALSITPTARVVLVSIARQEMVLLERAEIIRRYPISTSANPPSCQTDSFGTPTGLHKIADRIGADAPLGMVFKGRIATGQRYHECSPDQQAANLITSRILRLHGLEPELNSGPDRDSYQRYIYIHGTNHEDRIGHPFSGGCVEMRNTDVIELFERVQSGDLLWIDGD